MSGADCAVAGREELSLSSRSSSPLAERAGRMAPVVLGAREAAAALERRPRAPRARAARRRRSRAARGRADRPRARRRRRARRRTSREPRARRARDADDATRPCRARASTAATQLLRLAAVADRDHDVARHDLPGAAVHRLGRVQEGGGRAGRREQRRRVARDVLGLADAGHVHATAARLGRRAPARARARSAPASRRARSARELLERHVERAERLRARRRAPAPARAGSGASAKRRSRRRARARARARRAAIVGEGAEPLDAGGAAGVGEPRRVLPAEPVVQRGQQAAEEGVAGAGRVDAPSPGARARSPRSPRAAIAQPASPSVTTTARAAEARAQRARQLERIARRAAAPARAPRSSTASADRRPRSTASSVASSPSPGQRVGGRHVEIDHRRDARLARDLAAPRAPPRAGAATPRS